MGRSDLRRLGGIALGYQPRKIVRRLNLKDTPGDKINEARLHINRNLCRFWIEGCVGQWCHHHIHLRAFWQSYRILQTDLSLFDAAFVSNDTYG